MRQVHDETPAARWTEHIEAKRLKQGPIRLNRLDCCANCYKNLVYVDKTQMLC